MAAFRIFVLALLTVFGAAQLAGCASSPEQRATGQVFDDGLLTARVKRELFHEPGVSFTDVNVTTYRGVVQLSGFVPSEKYARIAEEAARRVEGVKAVKNDIRIAPRG